MVLVGEVVKAGVGAAAGDTSLYLQGNFIVDVGAAAVGPSNSPVVIVGVAEVAVGFGEAAGVDDGGPDVDGVGVVYLREEGGIHVFAVEE